MDNKTETMTEQELERTADELLAASDIKDAPKKRAPAVQRLRRSPPRSRTKLKPQRISWTSSWKRQKRAEKSAPRR